jgi:hypothetical protein
LTSAAGVLQESRQLLLRLLQPYRAAAFAGH